MVARVGWVSQPLEVGFGLANSQRNTLDPAELRGQKGHLPQEVTQRRQPKSTLNRLQSKCY